MGILEHIWGVSPAQDRVWAQVSGIAPSISEMRLFMPLQAFIDDSYNPDGIFVLGGYIAPVEAWAQFSKEWEEMLPLGTLAKNNKYHFKMSEMAMNPDRMKRVPGFYRVIENNVLISLACVFNLSEWERARARLSIPGRRIDWGFWGNKHLTAIRTMMDMFHANKRAITEHIPTLNQKIDFYFDNQTEKKVVLEAWESYLNNRADDIRDLYGATPRFEDDQEFLPLQAADFWAWWVRKWFSESKSIAELEQKIATSDFGGWKPAERRFPSIVIRLTEDQIVVDLKKDLQSVLQPGEIIHDAKLSPSHDVGE